MNKHELVLRDSIHLLVEMAHDARATHAAKVQELGPDAAAFEGGRSLGLMEAASLFKQQLVAFELDPSRNGFPASFDPERDLLK